MKKLVISLAGAAVVLLLVLGVVGCVMPNQPTDKAPDKPPEGTYSTDDLLASLDQLQGPASRSLTAAGQTVFSLPGGKALGISDLSSYLNAIKRNFASYVSTSSNGSLYLVQTVKLSWTNAAGARESGLMWVPFTWFRSKTFPVISYQHGTQVFRACAPSQFNGNPLAVFSSPDMMGALQNYVECIVGALMASAGYIVVMPDYVGFGDPLSTAIHPYVTQALGGSVAGIVAKARDALQNSPVKPNLSRTYLTGYSEGGYATMVGVPALAALAMDPEMGLLIRGVVPCDGAYSLSDVMLKQMIHDYVPPETPPKVPWYLLYAASGIQAADHVDLTWIFADDWAKDLAFFNGSKTTAFIDSNVPFGTVPRTMLSTAVVQELELEPGRGVVFNLLKANDAWALWSGPPSPVPLLIVHCPTDDIVPYANAVALANHFGISTDAIVQVPPVPFVETLLGSVHVAAYPTAMLAAFTAIQTINKIP